MIWNVNDKKIYLDEFNSDELIIKRIKNIPQIYFDENYFDENYFDEYNKVKINIEMKKEKLEIILGK